MAHRVRKNLPFVLLNDGYMALYTNTGHQVSHLVKVNVIDAVDEYPSYTVEGYCNIVKDKEEMMKCIEEWKKS